MPTLEEEPHGWRKWTAINATQISFAGMFVMSIAAGWLLQSVQLVNLQVKKLNESVERLASVEREASGRLERQTQSLITWTKLLFGVSAVLCVLTIVLIVVAIARR
jgi:hypothetical protein